MSRAAISDEVEIGDRLDGKPKDDALRIACANGMLEVRGKQRKLVEHTPILFNVHSLSFGYDPEATTTDWDTFLASVWEDDLDSPKLLHQWLGYLLSGETKAQKFMYLKGIRRAGKGVICRLATALVGMRNTTSIAMDTFGYNFGMQDLINKTLGILPDARDSTKANTAAALEKILMLTGEDMVTIPRKNKTAWSGKASARIMLTANLDVGFKDTTGALASRAIVLPFTRSFEGREDYELEDKLDAEMPGILNRVLDGLEELVAAGWRFTIPKASQAAKDELIDTLNPLNIFLRERCEVGDGKRVGVDELWNNHCWWRGTRGEEPWTKVYFGKQLRQLVSDLKQGKIPHPDFPTDPSKRINIHIGIGLIEVAQPESGQSDQEPPAAS